VVKQTGTLQERPAVRLHSLVNSEGKRKAGLALALRHRLYVIKITSILTDCFIGFSSRRRTDTYILEIRIRAAKIGNLYAFPPR
jgi:hypothetical protein